MALRYRLSPQLKFNIKSYLDREFVNKGLYINISSGYYDISGSRADVLSRVNGSTYESLFDNWIYETDASGVGSYPTTIASGVYIDGVFHSKGAAPYKPTIDYLNGRIIFEGTVVSSTSTVSTNFSYKHARIDYRKSDVIKIFSQAKDAIDFTQNATPSGLQRQLPRVVIDIQKRITTPYQLGGGKTHDTLVVLFVLSNNDTELDQIVDILTEDSSRKAIKGVDFNKIPELFTDNGDTASTYKNYTQLQNDNSYSFPTIFIDEARLIESFELHGISIARIHWNAITYMGLSP
jgi:hypothetical protein